MRISRLTPERARRRFGDLRKSGFRPINALSEEMMKLRAEVCDASILHGKRSEYDKDLTAGLTLYRVLPPERLTLRQAADTGVWRFLSLEVLPDIVHIRAGESESLFWKSKRRIWLMRVWWYIHLGWQGDEDATRHVLSKRTTDTIAQFVERPGRGGFRVELWRRIASRLGTRHLTEGQFRRLMKLNTALLVSIEPELSEGGVDGYVDRLFDAVAPDSAEAPHNAA